MKNTGFGLIVLGLMVVFSSCRADKVEAYEKWEFRVPEGFPPPVYTSKDNAQTPLKFELGKEIFYDPILSSDSTISCSSCHTQEHAFSDHNGAFSLGVNGTLGTRNSPSITNLAWQPYFMWDGGVNHIEFFSVAPITNPLEMNETMASVIDKLNDSEKYRNKFSEAFGTTEITDQMMLRALTQYMIVIISDNSKYDRYMRGEEEFSEQELSGLNLFREHCGSCHREPLFTDYKFRNNGLDSVFSDQGREHITQNEADRGKFKVPTLRNVAITYPYMHDGRFFSLKQVLNHYEHGIVNSATLDPELVGGIALTEDEKNDIIVFLQTLTDYDLLQNEFLSGPHQH